LLQIGVIAQSAFAQRSFAFGGLRGQDMTAEGFRINKFTCSGLLEPLCGGPIRLDFWHGNLS
jgi:hypothetical protein